MNKELKKSQMNCLHLQTNGDVGRRNIERSQLEGSETVLALTNDDENNMMACVWRGKTGLKKEQSQ